jgi:hypothetical protein
VTSRSPGTTRRLETFRRRRPLGSKSTSEPAESYVGKDSAVTITLNGQRHEAESRTWLGTRLKLPFLRNNLIVQIDIDEISPPAKRELFTSTRERMVEMGMKNLIYDEAIELLNDDDELRRLNDEMRDRAMSKGAKEVGEKIRRKLAKFVDTFLKNQTQKVKVDGRGPATVGPSPKPRGSKSPPRSTEDRHLPSVPTDIKFSRDPISITRGKRTTVWVHLDAKNGYLERHEDDLSLSFTSSLGGKVHEVGRSSLLAGKSRWMFFAEPDAPLGEGEIEVSLITPNGLLSTSAVVRVLPLQETTARKRQEKSVSVPGPNISWVHREDWDADFHERTVGQVAFGHDSTDIRVNRDHPLILDALNEKRLLSKEQIEGRAEKYLFAVACGLFRQGYAMKQMDSPPEEEQVAAEQERLAEAVLIAIDDKMVELED